MSRLSSHAYLKVGQLARMSTTDLLQVIQCANALIYVQDDDEKRVPVEMELYDAFRGLQADVAQIGKALGLPILPQLDKKP